MLPLDGTTVVSLEQAVAAPLATRHLADLGARVIKVERPKMGDFARAYDATVKGQSSYFVWLNRGKESLTLDLKSPEAAAVLDKLLARADVFVHNLAPGRAERSGLDARALGDRFERLITCAISGYGSSGPWSDRKAYDLLVQSETGLLSITGSATTVCKAGISVADIAAGMYGCQGILAALLQRATTGRGTSLEVSLFDALAEWMGAPLYYTKYGGSAPPRTEAHHASIAPYGPFRCRDDVVVVGLQNEREWARFCEVVLERSELARDPRFGSNAQRVANRAALHEMIERVFRDLPAADLLVRLDTARIATAKLNTIEDLISHPQLRARGRWSEVQTPQGPVEALRPPLDLDGVEARMGAVPAVGEHSDRILVELGFDRKTIEEWREQGVV
jgi:formyl-CoA transferase